MKKYAILTAMALGLTLTSHAKVWRVNNNVGVDADFTQITTAIAHASVVNTDTIYVEASATAYTSFTLTKKLVFIGNGYLLDGAANGNAGLQVNLNESQIDIVGQSSVTLNAGSEGSQFIGLTFQGAVLFNTISSAANISIEKCTFKYHPLTASGTKTFSNISVRKCFMNKPTGNTLFGSNITLHNFVLENCVIKTPVGYTYNFTINPASTNIIIRNNTFNLKLVANNAYVANNLFLDSYFESTFSSCIVKNNIFVYNQTGVTVGPLSVHGNNLVNQTVASLIVNTGSDDGKFKLAAGSPALGGGVDIGGVKPDCGAFGGNDPYVLSGIPNIPTIYSISFPNGNAVNVGGTSMLVDFSIRNNK